MTDKINLDNSSMLDLISCSLKEIRYGKIELTIHDSKVVQIEKSQKIRF